MYRLATMQTDVGWEGVFDAESENVSEMELRAAKESQGLHVEQVFMVYDYETGNPVSLFLNGVKYIAMKESPDA